MSDEVSDEKYFMIFDCNKIAPKKIRDDQLQVNFQLSLIQTLLLPQNNVFSFLGNGNFHKHTILQLLTTYKILFIYIQKTHPER